MAKGKTILQSMAIDKPAQVLVKETGRKIRKQMSKTEKRKREEWGSSRAQCNVTDKVVVTAAVNAKRECSVI